MAKGKKSALIYTDWINIFEELDDAEAGQLIKHYMRYINDLNPEPPSRIIKLVFEPIKLSLKRDLIKYESICERNYTNGAKGGRPLIKKPSGLINNPEEPKKPDSDIDNDSDIDSGKEKEKKKEKKVVNDFFAKIITAFQIEYFNENGVDYIVSNQGKENAAISKLIKYYKDQYPKSTTEETLNGLSAYFKNCCSIPDDWLHENMSIPTIMSQFTKINNILKNGKSKKVNGRSKIGDIEEMSRAIAANYTQS
jgi:hypothetical protein